MAEHEQVNSKMITYEQLAENFHLPINEVSKKLGICTTVLKKVCRRNGIPRWPYRKLKAIDKKISNLKTSLQKNPQESKRIHAEIVALQERKRLIMENPSCLSTEPASTETTTSSNFDEAYDDLNSSALLLSLTPNRDQNNSPEPSSRPSPRKVPRLSFSSSNRTEEEEEELLVASNLVELMSQHTFGGGAIAPDDTIMTPVQPTPTTTTQLPTPSFSSSSYAPMFTSSHPSAFSSSYPIISNSFPTSPLPTSSSSSGRPNSLSPPRVLTDMPVINPRSFFSPEECAPPIPHTQTSKSPTPLSKPINQATQKPSHLRSFSSAPILESLGEDQQPPLPSWFSRSLEEAVGLEQSPETKQEQDSTQPESQPKPEPQQPEPEPEPQPQPKQESSTLAVTPATTPTPRFVSPRPDTRPETPSGTKRAGRDVETLEAESRTQNSLTTKRSRNESPIVEAIALPSLILTTPPPPTLSS